MSYFIAISIYESSADAPDYQPLYEECFTLIEAQDEQQARQKAEAYARAQETSYPNCYGETITQSFKRLVDVRRLLYQSFADGTDLYARSFRNYSAYQAFEPLLNRDSL